MTCKMNCRIQKCHRIMAISWIYNVAPDRGSSFVAPRIEGKCARGKENVQTERVSISVRTSVSERMRRMAWNMENHRKCISIGILIYFHCINLKKKKELKPKKNKKKLLSWKCLDDVSARARGASCQLHVRRHFVPRTVSVLENAKPHAPHAPHDTLDVQKRFEPQFKWRKTIVNTVVVRLELCAIILLLLWLNA